MRILFSTFLLLIALSGAALSQPAPFGLQWGMTPQQLKASIPGLAFAGSDDFFDVYISETLPLPVAEAEAYRLLFARNGGGLQQITMEGRVYRSDWQGARGKGQYARLKGLISQSYGAPSKAREDNLAQTIKRSTAFYPCLMSSRCGVYASVWHKDDGSAVALRLQGLGSDSGRLVLTAEGPGFNTAQNR